MNKIPDQELEARIRIHRANGEGHDLARTLVRMGASFSNSKFAAIWKKLDAEAQVNVPTQAATPVVTAEPDWNALAKKAHDILNGAGETTYAALAKKMGVPFEVTLRVVGVLVNQRYNVVCDHETVELRKTLEEAPTRIIDTSKWGTKHHIYGITGDNHLGSRYSRLDVLNALFDIWKDQGVETVYQCGNIIDGEARFNVHDLIARGIKGQVDYLIENWPVRPGMETQFITGDDHEGWYIQREGIDIGKHIESEAISAGRSDLKYIGHMEANLDLRSGDGRSIMSLIHAGGGTAYAISYTVQKIVEAYQGGEKPNILLAGHYHKFDYSYPREVHGIQVGCTEDQTPFMRKKKLGAHVGGVTLEFDQDEHGIMHNVTVRWHPFYDRNFYQGNAWKYHFDPTTH